jgi:murein DD-endopeptidase MepM/ murein hydrolase activator NlpD
MIGSSDSSPRFIASLVARLAIYSIIPALILVGCVRPAPDMSSNSGEIVAQPENSLPIQQEQGSQTNNVQSSTAVSTCSLSSPDPMSQADSSDFFIFHTVEEGNTLGTIAEQYETDTATLVTLNQITDSNIIFTGQILRVPGPEYELLVSPRFEIIPDGELVYGPSAAAFDAHAFAKTSDGYLLNYEEEVEQQSLTGPEIVQLVADRHSINPKLLLAALEYQSGWITHDKPAEIEFALGYNNDDVSGLYRQLSWAANLLNWGYYGRSEGGMTSFLIGSEIPVTFASDTGLATGGVQHYLAARDHVTYESWLHDVGPEGFHETYNELFGNVIDQSESSILPDDLTQPPFKLPWASGETWYLTGGPHGGWNTGSAWAALDFVPPDTQAGCSPSESWVTAVADGIVSRSGFGAVVVDLDGDGFSGTGWAVTYMHLDNHNRLPAGTPVKTGDPLGHPGCEGGFTNGTHVHLTRTYNGRWVSADGTLPFDLDGWISQGAGNEYNGWLVRDGETKTADIFHTDDNAITAD